MADNINFNVASGEYSFYSLKEMPWHGLGQIDIEGVETSEEALKMAHLDYEVKLGDVIARFPDETEDQLLPKLRHIYRDDTKEIFDTVTNRYEVFQNYESLDVIFSIIKNPEITDKNQIVIQTAGALGKGERIFVTAKMPDYFINLGGTKDLIKKYIVFTSSHNKSGKVFALITDIRVVCNNTLNMALNTPNKVALKHTKNLRNRLNEFTNVLNIATGYSKEVRQVLEHLYTIKVTNEIVREYVYDMFVDPKKRKEIKQRGGEIDRVPDEIISVKVKNRVNEARLYIENGPGQDIAKGTAYWMYNGITSYIHNGMTYARNDIRFQSILSGVAESLIRKAFEEIKKYA